MEIFCYLIETWKRGNKNCHHCFHWLVKDVKHNTIVTFLGHYNTQGFCIPLLWEVSPKSNLKNKNTLHEDFVFKYCKMVTLLMTLRVKSFICCFIGIRVLPSAIGFSSSITEEVISLKVPTKVFKYLKTQTPFLKKKFGLEERDRKRERKIYHLKAWEIKKKGFWLLCARCGIYRNATMLTYVHKIHMFC